MMSYDGVMQFTSPSGLPQTLVWSVVLDDRHHSWTIKKTNIKYLRIDLDGLTAMLFDGRWIRRAFWFTNKTVWKTYHYLIDLYSCNEP